MANITINQGGRPTVITPERKGGLIVAKRLGLTDVEACKVVEIDRATLYRHLRTDPEFYHTFKAASLNPIHAAMTRVMDIITDTTHKYSDSVAGKMVRWFLERREPEQYGITCRYCKRRKIGGSWEKDPPQRRTTLESFSKEELALPKSVS